MSKNETALREPSSRFTAAFICFIILFFFGWFPLAGPLIGGTITGYLRGPDKQESVLTSVIAAVFASALFLMLTFLIGIGAIAEGDVAGLLGWIVIAGISLVYFYGLAALGGYIGAAFSNRERPYHSTQ